MWEEMTKNEPQKGSPSFQPEPDCCTDDNTKTDEEEDFQNLLMLASGRCPDLLLQLQQAAEVVTFPKHPPIDVPALPTVIEDSKLENSSPPMMVDDEVVEEELLMTSHVPSSEEDVTPVLAAAATPVAVLEEIYKLRHELNTLRKEMTMAFSSMDFKRVRKNRTLKNRCSFVNRRGEGCRGYKCKIPGSTLCYAHHILSAAACYPERRAKLY